MHRRRHTHQPVHSHFAAGGKHTLCPSCGVYAQRSVPMTSSVCSTVQRPAWAAPLACKDHMRIQASCKNEMQPLRASLRVQVCNAGRRLHAARVRGAGVRQLRGSGHATHKRAVASAARPAHNHHHARTEFISAGYGPVRTAVGRRRARMQGACDDVVTVL